MECNRQAILAALDHIFVEAANASNPTGTVVVAFRSAAGQSLSSADSFIPRLSTVTIHSPGVDRNDSMPQPPPEPPPTSDTNVNRPTCETKTYSKRHLTELLIKRARDIKMLPATAAKAIQLADDPNSSPAELATVIAQDPKLTTNILSLANSPVFPVYAAGQKVSCLKVAVTRLGFRQTKQMILVSSYSSMLNDMDWNETKTRETISKHSFLTGVLSTELNKLFNLGMQGEEFTAGLLHDVGRILLAVTIPKEFTTVDLLDFDESPAILEREKCIIGTNHAEIGAWFMSRNQLTDDLISVARYHHNPFDANRYNRLVALVSIADDLANHYQRFGVEGEYDCTDLEGVKLLQMLGAENTGEVLNEQWPAILEVATDKCHQLTT